MTKARSNAVAEAAKGDLSVGSGTNLASILAVGNNGETLVADSSATTGLRYQPPIQQNPVLNSAFQVFQRGTSVSVAASTSPYVADRWQAAVQANQASTYSQQSTNDTTNLPFIQNCIRVQRNSGQTGTGTINLAQSFETSNSRQLSGKFVVFSFYARAGANYSQTSNGLGAYVYTGTGTDQNVLTGYTGGAIPIAAATTLTTTWQRFQGSATIPADVTEIGVRFQYDPTGTAGANDYFEVTGVQLEVGSSGSKATPFHPYAATIQGELAACMRYYYRNTAPGGGNKGMASGISEQTTNAQVIVPLPVPMRVKPTAVEFSNVAITDTITYTTAATNVTIESGTPSVIRLSVAVTGQTQYRPVQLMLQTDGYLGITAEL
jgi:hypothetical protein